MTVRDEMLRFWNPETLAELKQKIVNPGTWHDEIPGYMRWLFDPAVWPLQDCREMTALDLGCGIGRLLAPVSCGTRKAIGLDISKKMIEFSREYLRNHPNAVTHLVNDDYSFPVETASVDFAYSVIVIQHIPEQSIVLKYLAELRRVLKTNGLIRLQTMKGKPPQTGFHGYHGQYYPSIGSFSSEIENAGFNIMNVQEGLGHPEWLWVTAGRK